MAAARYLSDRLVEARTREARERGESVAGMSTVEARREIICTCLYGADINPMAVEMCKLSLWLISLDRGKPFSFVDDRVLCGDALLGVTDVRQLKGVHIAPTLERLDNPGFTADVDAMLRDAVALRRRLAQPIDEFDPGRSLKAKRQLMNRLDETVGQLRDIADAIIAAGLRFDGRPGKALDDAYEGLSLALLREYPPDGGEGDRQDLERIEESGLTPPAETGLPHRRPLHWAVEVPEVIIEHGGFDAIIGNPPFLGGQKISGAMGDDYRSWLVQQVAGGDRGSADYFAYFFLRTQILLRDQGRIGMIAKNTIAQGVTRKIGLRRMLNDGFVITRAISSSPWPSASAGISYSVVWGSRGLETLPVPSYLDDTPCPRITSFLKPESRILGAPVPLQKNDDLVFQGSNVLGKGFVISEAEMREWISLDERNREVLQPYLGGSDVTKRPGCDASRWIINFHDYPESQASEYTLPWRRVYQTVRNQRSNNKRKARREKWWLYAERSPTLYATISELSHVIVMTLVSETLMPVRVSARQVFSHKLAVFTVDSFEIQSILSSELHRIWALTYSSSGTGMNYSPRDAFSGFPLPGASSELDKIGRRLDTQRREIMLRRRLGLTDLYNMVNDPVLSGDDDVDLMRGIHEELDRRVADAYGWDDLDMGHGFYVYRGMTRWTVTPQTRVELLDRLLKLNHERARAEAAASTGTKDADGNKRHGKARRGGSPSRPRRGAVLMDGASMGKTAGRRLTAGDARDRIVDWLSRSLIGPWDGPEEVIEGNPRAAYSVGTLAPVRLDPDGPTNADDREQAETITPAADATGVPVAAGETDVDSSEDDEDAEDRPPSSVSIAPSSMGLRFRVRAGTDLSVRCRWGSYSRDGETEPDEKGRTFTTYRRTPHDVVVPLTSNTLAAAIDHERVLRVEPEVQVDVQAYREADESLLVEAALRNMRTTTGAMPPSEWMFQTQMVITAADGSDAFLPIHDPVRDAADFVTLAEEFPEDAALELRYRDRLEFAVGRTCSAVWSVDTVETGDLDQPLVWLGGLALGHGHRTAKTVATNWLPVAETPQTASRRVDGLQTWMRALAQLEARDARAALSPLADGYAAWLAGQRETARGLPGHLQQTAEDSVDLAGLVVDRLRDGIALLARDESALRAFRFMNRVMADQRVHTEIVRRRADDPSLPAAVVEPDPAAPDYEERSQRVASWRPFQLGFILMQLPQLVDPTRAERSDEHTAQVELLFFPTGGGKTEAYLGLAAYTFAIRRLQGVVDADGEELNGCDGVAVLMRYTLRLLTTQQFQRATTMVCAAELARREHPEVWGEIPFRIGLWVGSSVTPKRYVEAEREIHKVRSEGWGQATVLQFQACPWCGAHIDATRDVEADSDRRRIRVHCGAMPDECPFAAHGQVSEGLPVLTTDEEIYRLVPTFLLATVDKFARLAREGAAASIFGEVAEYCPRHGYRHPDDARDVCGGSTHHNATRDGRLPAVDVRRVTRRLRPPDLIIQDELHLITGALGTAVGLFETGVDVLCTWRTPDRATVRPLIVASTATVRNVGEQVRGLYGRDVGVFPPQVLDAADTWFSHDLAISTEHPGRRYVGLCMHAVRLTLAEIRASELLLLAGQTLLDRHGPDEAGAVDPYLTLVDYFSSTRELAGMRRYLDDDIWTRISNPKPRGRYEPRAWGRGLNIGELTSRIPSQKIGQTLAALAVPFDWRWDSGPGWERRKQLAEARANRSARRKSSRHGAEAPTRDVPRPFDVVLATSMLQVGVDVGRLGLMMVVGQPKNTAEYIQATSRVGRTSGKPGLVVTLANPSRPRDQAHFEQFEHYHRTFYRQVEALSVTPLSESSLERGLTATLVSVARVAQAREDEGLSPNPGALRIRRWTAFVQEVIDRIVARAITAAAPDGREEDTQAAVGETVRRRLERRLDEWLARAYGAEELFYDRRDRPEHSLLVSPEERSATGPDGVFRVANSMREVQPELNLMLSTADGHLATPEPAEGPLPWVFPKGEEARQQEKGEDR